MAHMYPKDGPTKDTTSTAERKVFDVLQHYLSDDYYVFHGVSWTDKRPDSTIQDGEIDFVVVHAKRGMLLIEVKGGAIRYDGEHKQWYSQDRYGLEHAIKDPFSQASKSTHSLKKHIQDRDESKSYSDQYYAQYCVWFPDITYRSGEFPLPHVRDDLVLDSAALSHPQEALSAIMQQGSRNMGTAARDALVSVLAPSREVRARLKDDIIGQETYFVRLLDAQCRVLDTLLRYPRVTLRGTAGTGKTLLALEAARRYAREGLDVLFLCVTPALAQWVRRLLNEEPAQIVQRITVMHVEALAQLLRDHAEQTIGALRDAEWGEHEELGDNVRQNRLAALVARCVGALERGGNLGQFDAILVDEAQDINRPLWTPLYKLLRDRLNGRYLVFADPCQRYDLGEWFPTVPNGYHEQFLTTNIRNTKAIFSVTQQFYGGMDAPSCDGPDGQPVECYDPARGAAEASPEERDAVALQKVLRKLIHEQGISAEDILVVTCRSKHTSRLLGHREIGPYKLDRNWTTAKRDDTDTTVHITTARSAKGMEANVVIIAELDGISNELHRNNWLYVAASRAKHHLIVLDVINQFMPNQASFAAAGVRPRIRQVDFE